MARGFGEIWTADALSMEPGTGKGRSSGMPNVHKPSFQRGAVLISASTSDVFTWPMGHCLGELLGHLELVMVECCPAKFK